MIGDGDSLVVQAQAILVDDVTEPLVQAVEAGPARLALVLGGQPGAGKSALVRELAVRLLRQAMYVPIDHAASLIGIAPVVLKRLILRDELTAVTRDDQVYVSLASALDFRDRYAASRRKGLDEMFRVTNEGGLYDAEFDPS
jgi:hypothetical protein